MHTAICTFDDRTTAQAAVDRLLQAGYDRNDVHLQYRLSDGTPVGEEPYAAWDGMEHEVAVSHKALESFGNFFGRLFGHDDASGHGSTYSSAVERGHCVVVVDARDDAEAQRAQSILHGMEASDMNVVHRATQPPLREIIAARKAAGMEPSFGAARPETGAVRERATASQGWGEQRTLDVQPDPDDVTHAPGLRYAPDRDKPNN
jgi:hypothetical protein